MVFLHYCLCFDKKTAGVEYGEEIAITRRQQNDDGSERLDTMLAGWFADADSGLDNEIITPYGEIEWNSKKASEKGSEEYIIDIRPNR